MTDDDKEILREIVLCNIEAETVDMLKKEFEEKAEVYEEHESN